VIGDSLNITSEAPATPPGGAAPVVNDSVGQDVDSLFPHPPAGETLAPAAPLPIDLGALKRKSISGGAITLTSQFAIIVIQLFSTVALARLLSPQDYGKIAMVAAVTSFAGLFRDMGLSTASIQKLHLSHAQMSTLFWINVGMGAALTIVVAAAAPVVGWFYEDASLVPLTAALSTTFVIASFGSQHSALLIRDLQFGRQAVAGICGSLVTLVVAVVLAVMGKGYWSLAFGTLAGTLTTTAMLFWLSPFRPRQPQRGSGVRDMLRFGVNVTAFDFVNYFHRNLDNILIGRIWGADALGLYSRAYSLLMLPVNNLRGPITAVAYPAMSKLQAHPEQYKTYYGKVVSVLAMISMPFSAFMFITCKDIIRLALGSRWDGTASLFQILAIVAFIQPVATTGGLVMLSRGLVRRYVRLGLVRALLVSAGFILGVRWGAVGVAWSYVATTYLGLLPFLYWICHGTPVSVSYFLRQIWQPAVASTIAAAATLIAYKAFLNNGPSDAFRAVTFAAIVFLPSYVLSLSVFPGAACRIGDLPKLVKLGRI
jgi:polysaccharide transporter, PST family